MKIKNSTTWDKWFLQRMTSWCCQQLGLPVRDVRLCAFRNSRSSWGGAAYWWKGCITVCVGNDSWFPTTTHRHASGLQEAVVDRLEALVMVTAHELAHLLQRHCKRRKFSSGGGMEAATDWHAHPVLQKFRQEREALVAIWAAPPVASVKPTISLRDKRAKKAQDDLAKWQRRLTLAKTKVRKLTVRVRYYERLIPNPINP